MIPHRNRCIKDCPRCFGGQEPGPSPRRMLLEISIERIVLFEIKPWPIVEPSASARLLIDIKAQRLDQMQLATSRHAGASDVACVIGYLRGYQHDVQAWILQGAAGRHRKTRSRLDRIRCGLRWFGIRLTHAKIVGIQLARVSTICKHWVFANHLLDRSLERWAERIALPTDHAVGGHHDRVWDRPDFELTIDALLLVKQMRVRYPV